MSLNVVLRGLASFAAALVCFASSHLAAAITITVDPSTPLTNYWFGGEWNTDGNLEGWTTTQITNTVT